MQVTYLPTGSSRMHLEHPRLHSSQGLGVGCKTRAIFLVTEQFCVLIVLGVTPIYTRGKTAQTHMQKEWNLNEAWACANVTPPGLWRRSVDTPVLPLGEAGRREQRTCLYCFLQLLSCLQLVVDKWLPPWSTLVDHQPMQTATWRSHSRQQSFTGRDWGLYLSVTSVC